MKMEMQMVKVKYLTKREIEWNAERLLTEFGEHYGEVGQPPVPVEEILENHLKLTLEIDDLESRLGFQDVLGALWAPERLVAIDQRLEPTEHPNREGRYRYTVGHEIGHWEQHRHYFLPDPNQGLLFQGVVKEPSLICRTSQSKEPIEWQADFFSACLLMPKRMVMAAWQQREQWQRLQSPSLFSRGEVDSWQAMGLVGTLTGTAAELATNELARRFGVSNQAMRIRLEELSLIQGGQTSLFPAQMSG